jgi:hypothetical protein
MLPVVAQIAAAAAADADAAGRLLLRQLPAYDDINMRDSERERR